MLKKTLIAFTLLLLWFLGNSSRDYAAQVTQKTSDAPTGTLQKMIVESGAATMELDLNGLNGSSSLVARPVTLQFAVGANSFFPILVFNDLLRGPEQGSMALIPQGSPLAGINNVPAALSASLKQLAIERLASSGQFDLAVRDATTGFTFFDIEGHQYSYDANAESLTISNGRLLVSKEFANALGRPSDAGAVVGKISVGAAMQPIEITKVVSGEPKSVMMPPLSKASAELPTRTSGPDVIVGDLPDMEQMGSGGTQVGLAVATTSCNNGDQPVDWFALP